RVFRDLVLEATRSDIVGQAARLPEQKESSSRRLDLQTKAAKLLAGEVLAKRLVLNEWNEAIEQWILRLNWLHEWMPDLKLPGITEEDRATLVEQVCHGAVSYKEIK